MRKITSLLTLAAASAAILHADEEYLFQPPNCTTCKFWAPEVAIAGDVAAISAKTNHNGQGLVYLFDAQTGQYLREVTASDGHGGDAFGTSLDLDEESLVVGASQATFEGQAYVYDVASGAEQFLLTGSDSFSGDEFGKSVAVDGRKVLVGAPYAGKTWKRTGAAYLFDRETGQELDVYLPQGGKHYAGFGYAVDLDETSGYAVVGAPFAYGGPFGIGAAYVYDVRNGKQLYELAAEVPLECVNFGFDVVVDGTIALISAPGYDQPNEGHGTVYVFDLTTGQQLHQWTTEDESWIEQFGYGIDLDGDVAVVSEYVGGVVSAYHVPSGHKIAEVSTTGWSDQTGVGVAIQGGLVIASTKDGGNGLGGAFAFDLGLDDIGTRFCAAVDNSTGGAGSLDLVGSDDADDECVIVRADGLIGGQFGMLLASQASGSVNPPGSDGQLCLGGGIGRYDVDLVDDAGGISILLDLDQTPTPGGTVEIQPGETWYFQVWYADGGSSNFTDAIEVTFH